MKAFTHTVIGRWLVKKKGELDGWILYQRRKSYFPLLEKMVKEGELSIISCNCFAGRIMQDLKMKYNTPTLGLYFMYPDYIEFLQHLDYYLKEAKLEFVEHSKYKLGNEQREAWAKTHNRYPIGLLDGKVEIHFMHYLTKEDAATKWYKRAKRVNFDNLLIVGMDRDCCTEQDIRTFDTLPYERKIMFSTHNLKELKSNCFVKEFANMDSVGEPYQYTDIYYRYLTERFK